MADKLIGVAVAGDRQASLQFEAFPEFARDRLRGRLERILHRLTGAIEAAAPVRTGKLRADIGGRIYEHENRIAAVAGVRLDAGMGRGRKGLSAAGKAATLEYGSTGRPFEVRRGNRAYRRRGGVMERRYLRGPAARQRDASLAELQQAVDEAVRDASR